MWQQAFAASRFKSMMSRDLNYAYLSWKTEETKERTPKFTDEGVRQQVLRAWKMIEAREPALKAAQSLAAEASKANEPLKKLFADRPDLTAVTPRPFSWMTFGNVAYGSSPSARLGTVSEVDSAGEDFMKTVFSLQAGETGVAMNAPQTVAYVIRVTAFSPPQDALWKQFETEDFTKYASVADDDRRKIVRAWLQEIKTSAGFHWEAGHKPEQRAAESEVPEED